MFSSVGLFAQNGNAENQSAKPSDLAWVKLNGKCGFINSKGETIIEPQFDEALNFSANGLAIVRQNGKWGYIDTTGKMVIQPQFDLACDFSANGLADRKSVV